MHTFQARKTLKMRVPNASIPVEEYLKEPQWLVAAITAADQVETLGDNHFRLQLSPKTFMQLQFQPQVDLQVWTDTEGTLHLRSTDCQIIGLEKLQKNFAMELSGELTSRSQGTKTHLQGAVSIQVKLEFPPVLKMVPDAVIKPAGNAFIGGILRTMKGRVRKQFVRDYRRWVAAQSAQTPSEVAKERV